MATKDIVILAIDTSCDDTSAAVLINDNVFSNVVSSQIEIHRKWGGVVPMLAKRAHQDRIYTVIKEAMKGAHKKWKHVKAISATFGPGLAPALEVGLNAAKHLSKTYRIPLIATNHLSGHLLSGFLKDEDGKYYSKSDTLRKLAEDEIKESDLFPIIAFIVSGGHTEMILMQSWIEYEKIGQTLDDAAGEAFDKVARLLGLPFPGGKQINELANDGDKTAFDLPRPMKTRPDFNFSFAGLKTACLYKLRDLEKELSEADYKKMIPDFCASFQEAVVDSLLFKLDKAIEEHAPSTVLFGGGVIANTRLRHRATEMMKNKNIGLIIPDRKFCTDNAAMIGLAAFHQYNSGDFADAYKLDRNPIASL